MSSKTFLILFFAILALGYFVSAEEEKCDERVENIYEESSNTKTEFDLMQGLNNIYDTGLKLYDSLFETFEKYLIKMIRQIENLISGIAKMANVAVRKFIEDI